MSFGYNTRKWFMIILFKFNTQPKYGTFKEEVPTTFYTATISPSEIGNQAEAAGARFVEATKTQTLIAGCPGICQRLGDDRDSEVWIKREDGWSHCDTPEGDEDIRDAGHRRPAQSHYNLVLVQSSSDNERIWFGDSFRSLSMISARVCAL